MANRPIKLLAQTNGTKSKLYMAIKNIFRALFLCTTFALTANTANAQDKLAMQAPVDRRANPIDTVVINRLRETEEYDEPASDLYNDWDNRYAHRATPLPDHYRIDLRGFAMPTPSRVITSNFGRRWGRRHQGLDIKVYIGDTIRSAFSGRVRVVKYDGRGYGKYVVIRHNNGLETIYGHLSRQLVRENQYVQAGEPIGLGGNTGRSTGSHLHFETRLCGVALNPALFFDFAHQDVTGDFYTFRRSSIESESARATALRGTSSSLGYSRENIQGRGSYRPQPRRSSQQEYNTDYSSRIPQSANANSGERLFYHKVLEGETLASIAEQHGVSIDQLIRMNGLSRFTKLSAGQLIKISK